MRRYARQFVRLYLTLAFCLAGGLALFNAVVDPYNLYPTIHLTSLEPYKPNNDHRRAKAALVRQHHDWNTLILGSSYAVVGMDATHPALGDGHAFNLGLNGGKLEEQLGALRYAWRYGHPIQHVILIYDNQWFFKTAKPTTDYVESPFNPNYAYIEYMGSNLLGTQATEHAWHAIRQWREGQHATDDPHGRRIKPVLSADIPQRLAFDEYLNAPDLKAPPDSDAANLDLFQQFASFCLERDIQLTVFIPPAHVSLLERFDASGYWPTWQDGKRRLLTLAEQLNQHHPDAPPVTLWDFNSISPYTTEPIPPAGDTQTRLKWFWDPGHFKKPLGDAMLQRAITEPTSPQAPFGTRLTADNIEPYLADLRESFNRYQASKTARPAQSP